MLNRLEDVFASLHRHDVRYVVKGQPFHVASRADLIASKRAAGRPVDLEDVRLLEAGSRKDAGQPGGGS